MAKVMKGIIRKKGIEYHVNQVQLPGVSNLNEAHLALVNVALGNDFIMSENEIIDLGTSKEYDHIKVWYEDPATEYGVLPPEEHEDEEESHELSGKVEYLGNSLIVRGIRVHHRGAQNYIVTTINSQPAEEMLKKEKIVEVAVELLKQFGYMQGQAQSMVVVPHAPITDTEEAVEYVKDLIDLELKEQEQALEVPAKNAKAWSGWTKEGNK